MMNKEQKTSYINEMETKFQNNKAVLVTHYQGLTMTQLDELRSQMREHGIRVDLSKADGLKKEFVKEENKRLLEIKKLSGVDVEIWAAASVAKAFASCILPLSNSSFISASNSSFTSEKLLTKFNGF